MGDPHSRGAARAMGMRMQPAVDWREHDARQARVRQVWVGVGAAVALVWVGGVLWFRPWG